MKREEILVFGGTGSPTLTDRICSCLGVPRGKSEVFHFSEGNTFVRVLENVRGRETYIVQSTAYPANDKFMELIFWIDALKRASADKVTVVMPYFSYAKGDKKDEPRVSIRARVCADMIEAAGADRVVTMDLHASQIQGFFRVPVDDLYAWKTLGAAAREHMANDVVVVSPDSGFIRKARQFATFLNAPLAIGDKERKGHDENAEILHIIGDVAGRDALVVDDFTISGGTLIDIAHKLRDRGARRVCAAVTHGVFSAGSMERIDASPIEMLLVTDTVENQPVQFSPKIEMVSVAPLFAEAIRRIHDRESISGLFL